MTACTDSSGPGHICDRITTRDGGFNISTLCGLGTTGGTSNHVADEQDRVISFDFDISCTDGSERIVGSVFDVVYNGAGDVVSFEATINGTSCTYPR